MKSVLSFRHLRLLAFAVAMAAAPLAAQAANNLWNGTWKLNIQRSMPGAKDEAAEDYRE